MIMKKLAHALMVSSLTFILGCAASQPPAAGAWDVEWNTPLGALSSVLTLNPDGSGHMVTQGMGAGGPLWGITFEGNTVNFEVTVDAQGQPLLLDFNGTVNGDSLEGSFGSDFGQFAVTGTRK
jgi:hypothetical protein